MTKSQFAFLSSAREFFRLYRPVYFWTLTLPGVESDWVFGPSWNRLKVTLCNFFGGRIKGLRVIEVHPGGHGLHLHMIVDQRIDVRIFRNLCERMGFGRIQVSICRVETAEYMAKYLGKQDIVKNIRRWGAIGGYKPTRVRDVEVISDLTKSVKIVMLLTGRKNIPIRYIDMLKQGRTEEEIARLIYNERNMKVKGEVCQENIS